MLGNNVDQWVINNHANQVTQTLRQAFSQIESVNTWFKNNPPVTDSNGVTTDILVANFGFTQQEATDVRNFFSQADKIRTDNQATWDLGRRFTGMD